MEQIIAIKKKFKLKKINMVKLQLGYKLHKNGRKMQLRVWENEICKNNTSAKYFGKSYK